MLVIDIGARSNVLDIVKSLRIGKSAAKCPKGLRVGIKVQRLER